MMLQKKEHQYFVKTPEKCKIIFPSTHVVFEGKEQFTENIKEDYEKFPFLPYAISKG